MLPENLSGTTVSQCLRYEPASFSLNGQIVRGRFVNASNKAELVWLLKLDASVCVDGDGGDSINQKAENVVRLQLVLTPTDYQRFGKYSNQRVSVDGTLFYGHTQHHFTEVLLSVSAIHLNECAALLH